MSTSIQKFAGDTDLFVLIVSTDTESIDPQPAECIGIVMHDDPDKVQIDWVEDPESPDGGFWNVWIINDRPVAEEEPQPEGE